MKKYFILFTILACVTFAASTAHAEPYKWEDDKGNLFFGSTPPPDAKNVSKVSNKGVSRYSSSKMLDRMGYLKKDQPQVEDDEATPESEPGTVGIPESLLSVIEQSEIRLAFNGRNELTSCKVTLTNPTSKTYVDVDASFSLPDGTFVRADGPTVLAPGDSGEYALAESELPKPVVVAGLEGDEPSVFGAEQVTMLIYGLEAKKPVGDFARELTSEDAEDALEQ